MGNKKRIRYVTESSRQRNSTRRLRRYYCFKFHLVDMNIHGRFLVQFDGFGLHVIGLQISKYSGWVIRFVRRRL